MNKELLYKSKKQTTNQVWIKEGVKVPRGYSEDDEIGYVYFCLIYDRENKRYWLKVGKACDVLSRMVQHCNYYQTRVIIVWISPEYSVYTALRVEKKFILYGKDNENWEYIRNDRFVLPKSCRKIEITVKKTYVVEW